MNDLGFDWKSEARRCLKAHGGEVSTKQAYTWFAKEHPELPSMRPHWKEKVRQSLQMVGRKHKALRGLWLEKPSGNGHRRDGHGQMLLP